MARAGAQIRRDTVTGRHSSSLMKPGSLPWAAAPGVRAVMPGDRSDVPLSGNSSPSSGFVDARPANNYGKVVKGELRDLLRGEVTDGPQVSRPKARPHR